MSSLYAGDLGPGLPAGARAGFVDAMAHASVVVAIVAALGAALAWRGLPAAAGLEPEGAPVTAR